MFQERYREWKAYCSRPDVSELSSDDAYVRNAPFEGIVALGEPAIPFIVEKLRHDPAAHWLIHAMERITQRTFTRDEIEAARAKYGSPLGNQAFARMWIEWREQQAE